VTVAVEAPRPRRGRPGQPDRPDQCDERDEGAQDRHPRLALEQGDQHEAEVDEQGEDEAQPVLLLLAAEFAHAERREPGQDQQHERRGEHHDLHALAPFLAPVHVVEVEDQGELVQHQPRAHAEDHRAHPGAGPVAPARDRPEAADDAQHHAGHHVVDVHPARDDVAERALPGPDQAGDDPGDGEGEHEGGQCEEQGQFPGLDDVPVQPVTHTTHPEKPLSS